MVFIFLLVSLTSCQTEDSAKHHKEIQDWMQKNGKIKTLSTTAMIADIVKSIGGEHVDSIALIHGQLDPHTYQLVKGDDEKLAFADIIFYNGLGLEHGPSLQNYLENHSNAIGLGNKIYAEEPELILKVNGQLDPHIWMDVSLWNKTIPFITEKLIQIDPQHAEEYQANSLRTMQLLDESHHAIKKSLQEIPNENRFLVTSHDAFNYFARAYLASPEELSNMTWDKRFAAPEGLAPESQLSSTDIQAIINHLMKYRIHVLFPESNVSKDSIQKIVSAGKEKGMDLKIASESLYGDAMGKKGSDGDTYVNMMKHNAKVIAHYLRNMHEPE